MGQCCTRRKLPPQPNPKPAPQPDPSPQLELPVNPPSRPVPNIPSRLVRALFDYEGTMDEDLPFRKGDVLKVLNDSSETNSEWWFAQNMESGVQGYIPSNYVTETSNQLLMSDWYFEIDRREAERLMLPPGHARGTFLVRKAADGQHALSVRDIDAKGNTVKHYKIRTSDDKSAYFISPKRTFKDLFDLIAHYKTTEDGLCCKLVVPCPKERPMVVFRELEIDRGNIELKMKIGGGHFGEVWKGKWKTLDVAVKMLKEGTMQVEAFLDEAKVMHQLRHKNLVQLYALCTAGGPIWIVTEYMNKGALLEVLRADKGRDLKFPVLIDFLAQAAMGLQYCEDRRIVHRDIRAANILVDSNRTIKVADFGLAKCVHEDEYIAGENAKFPVKWTAPEAAWDRKFTIKSDVWSYGVLIYETVTYGRMPYPGMTGHQVLQELERGYRMPKPEGFECPDSLYQIQLQCWNKNADSRPTFEYLAALFEDYFASTEPNYRDA